MLNNPEISVLMPVYNAELYLKDAIDSILNQSFTDFEFIIINDGSTDKSKDIILSYQDQRIRYVENETNLKLITTLNKGIEISRGKYIARMDADDLSLPKRLEVQQKFMKANSDICLCGTWFLTFGAMNQIVKYASSYEDIRVHMLHQTQFCHPTIFFRKEIITQNKFVFDEKFIHAEDYELFVRISQKFRVANIPEILLKYRMHDSSVSNKYEDIQAENTKKIIIDQFRKLKQDFTDEDYSLYLDFAHANFSAFSYQKVLKLDRLITSLLKENEASAFLPHLKLKEYWSEKLFHICYNVVDCMDIWKNSIFFDKSKMNLSKKIKKLLKR